MTIRSCRRREFITLLGAAALAPATLWPRAGRAQQPAAKIPRIGIIDDSPIWHSFRRGLRDLGYVEGQNIAFEYRYADGSPERLAEVAAALVRRPVDLIATYGTPSTHAAKPATTTVPSRVTGHGTPGRAQLVERFARPRGNITGNTVLSPDLSAKRLQLLKEVIPSAARVATRENVVAGGFMSYGASLPDLFRRAASYAHRILQGTKPAELPIEEPAKFELVVNLKTAKTLGLAIQESFMLRVDEVIE